MGLLDDAIREHMELKRLRGADPGELARQEHDALGPVVREHDPDFANVGQETAELDMRTVLDEQHEVADRATRIDSAGLGGAPGEDESPIPDEIPGQERLWLDQQQMSRDFDFDG